MNLKVILIFVTATILIGGGGVYLMSRTPNAAQLEKTEKAKFFTDHDKYDWGNINYSGGDAKHSFEIKNSGQAQLTLANIKTSCMCTTAKITTKSGTSPIVKMHEVSDWKGVLEPGEVGKLEVDFDPTFHGPTGTGPIERIISVETSDPNRPYFEFNLKGVVIKT